MSLLLPPLNHCKASLILTTHPPFPLSFQFLVYDYDSSGKHDFIGEFTSTFQEMQEGTANPGQEVLQRPPPLPKNLTKIPGKILKEMLKSPSHTIGGGEGGKLRAQPKD